MNKKWMNAEGGAVVLWGVQKVKRRKEGLGRAFGPWTGFGPVRPMNLGSVRERYLRVARPFFPHFFFSFSLFSSLRAKRSLLSPLYLHLLRLENGGRRWSETAPTRWPTVLDGGVAVGVVKTTPFLIFFSSFYSFFLSLFDSTFQISKPQTQTSRS